MGRAPTGGEFSQPGCDSKIRRHWGQCLATALVLFVAATAIPSIASAAPSKKGCNNRNLNQIDKLLNCVDADDVLGHLEVLQDIADANGGTRASGTPGYDASADYVAELLVGAGYTVERQEFSFSLYTENSSALNVDSTEIATQTMEYSGSGALRPVT